MNNVILLHQDIPYKCECDYERHIDFLTDYKMEQKICITKGTMLMYKILYYQASNGVSWTIGPLYNS